MKPQPRSRVRALLPCFMRPVSPTPLIAESDPARPKSKAPPDEPRQCADVSNVLRRRPKTSAESSVSASSSVLGRPDPRWERINYNRIPPSRPQGSTAIRRPPANAGTGPIPEPLAPFEFCCGRFGQTAAALSLCVAISRKEAPKYVSKETSNAWVRILLGPRRTTAHADAYCT